jgi:hypothetical protein
VGKGREGGRSNYKIVDTAPGRREGAEGQKGKLESEREKGKEGSRRRMGTLTNPLSIGKNGIGHGQVSVSHPKNVSPGIPEFGVIDRHVDFQIRRNVHARQGAFH